MAVLITFACQSAPEPVTTPTPSHAASPDSASEPSASATFSPLTTIRLERAFPNINPSGMVYFTHAGDKTDRIFLVLQDGRIIVFPNDEGISQFTVFLDLQPHVKVGREEGLLGLAFDPDYQENRRFYVYYSAPSPRRSVLSRFITRPDDPNRADSASEQVLLEVSQPFSNHNGGMLAFGPDGYLYVGLGDGGSGGDPQGNGQNKETLLGALLKIDVSGDAGYTIPLDNPFAEQTRARPEIWAYGLRNPWRFSFDRLSGTLWLADVGQNAWEEINIITRGGNFGWNRMEGRQCYPSDETTCNQEGLVAPIAQYSHAEGCSITGGYVYRGSRVPNLIGAYLYGDFCSGRIWGLRYDELRGITEHVQLADTSLAISSFGEDEAGEVYVLDYAGGIYRFMGP